MNIPGILPGKNSSFHKNLLICVLFIIVFVIALLSSISYIEAQNELIDKNLLLKEETEISVTQWMTLVDQGLKMYDDTLNTQMIEGFRGFIDEYERTGRPCTDGPHRAEGETRRDDGPVHDQQHGGHRVQHLRA